MAHCSTLPATRLKADGINLLKNPSFREGIDHWAHSGAGALNPAPRGGIQGSPGAEMTGGCLSPMLVPSPDQTGPADRFYRFAVMAKGHETIEVGVAAVISAADNKTASAVRWAPPVKLSGDWQQIEISGREENPRCLALQPLIRLPESSRGSILLGAADFRYHTVPGAQISGIPACQVGYPGKRIGLQLSVSKDGKPCGAIPVNIRIAVPPVQSGSEPRGVKLKTDAAGALEYAVEIPSENPGEFMQLTVSVPEFGLAKSLFIPVCAKAEVAGAAALAAQIKLSGDLFILYIGDSLSDRCRGHNYADMADYYLNLYNPGRASFKNAGVGGDFISRVWERIEGTRGRAPAYRQEAYADLLARKPDLIFIFLGANDSKAPSADNYKTPFVALARQYAEFNLLVDYLRAETKARLAFISAASLFQPPQEKKAAQLRTENKPHNLFGLDEHIVNFNNVLKQISAEKNIDYIDVYTPTRDHPEKQKLFIADGVHISEAGNHLVARAILEYMRSRHPGQPDA